jgi:CBS domain-containing membrane protein
MQSLVDGTKKFRKFIGLQTSSTPVEKLLSTLGGIISIALVFYVSRFFAGTQAALAILPSMGATAVLLFAVPHGALSQPWPIFGGHLLSALTGVACMLCIDNMILAAAMAVGLSIGMMHVFRCVHPPGGATALAAVIGGETVHALGFGYVLFPTFANCVVMFMAGLFFNNLFAWRRYPSSLMRYEKSFDSPETRLITVSHIKQAMQTLDEVLDIEPEQIKYLVDRADEIMNREKLADFKLELGAFYTNGKPGLAWSVRQVVDVAPHEDPHRYQVIFRTVDGANRKLSGSCSLVEFSGWAKEKMRPVSKPD